MVQFAAFQDGIEVNGTTIMSIVDGMGAFRATAIKLLDDSGLGAVVPDEKHWYSQQLWLNAFKKVSTDIGDGALLLIGKSIPETAVFPPDIDNVEKALASIDIAYHLNHRDPFGRVLFDPTRGDADTMLEGIGHYGYEKVEGENKAIMRCENPYPCAFDRGIITAMANRFAHARVLHDDSQPCRKKGDESCTYLVSWS